MAAAVRGRWAVLLAALVVSGASGWLGVWQLSRAAQKEALQASLEARGALPAVAQSDLMTHPNAAAEWHYRRVVLRGRWLAAHTVYLDNRQMNGRPGFFVVTPLVWPGGAVLVQRGWVARDNNVRARLPALATPGGEVEVSGRIAPVPARLYEFSGASAGTIRQNLDLEDFSREIGVALLPLSVLQDDFAPSSSGSAPPGALAADGLLRRWPQPAIDVQKHYGYAFQWFAICAVTAGLYVWFQIVQPRCRRGVRPAD